MRLNTSITSKRLVNLLLPYAVLEYYSVMLVYYVLTSINVIRETLISFGANKRSKI